MSEDVDEAEKVEERADMIDGGSTGRGSIL